MKRRYPVITILILPALLPLIASRAHMLCVKVIISPASSRWNIYTSADINVSRARQFINRKVILVESKLKMYSLCQLANSASLAHRLAMSSSPCIAINRLAAGCMRLRATERSCREREVLRAVGQPRINDTWPCYCSIVQHLVPSPRLPLPTLCQSTHHLSQTNISYTNS